MVVLFAVLLDQRVQREAVIFLVLTGLIVFGAAHLLAGGLYRMLLELFRAISRTDPAGDRPLQGTRIYLLGQIASAMAIPMALMFIFLPDRNGPRDNPGVVLLLAGVPCAFFVMLSLVTFFAGLGLMVRDTFVRHRDIIEKRDAERRRRIDDADDPHTEIIPTALPAELRAHVKEDR
jgi:ABC-type polysaccharide/polyol phosphate export permease